MIDYTLAAFVVLVKQTVVSLLSMIWALLFIASHNKMRRKSTQLLLCVFVRTSKHTQETIFIGNIL